MKNTFDLEREYQRYLALMDISEPEMHPVQKIETRRAFMGACGSMLLLFRDVLPALEEEQFILTMDDMINQVKEFFIKETKKTENDNRTD